MHIAAVGKALPPHYYEQDELIAVVQQAWSSQHHNPRRVQDLHRAVQVGSRHLALPLDQYQDLDFTRSNDAFIRVGTDVGEEAIRAALSGCGLNPQDVDALFFVTVTGLATPSLDARLVNRLGLRTDVKRIPIFGLGCVAGAAGTARVADYLRGHPDDVVVLLSVELCSLTVQRNDMSIANVISVGLFGDGAAALVAVGDRRWEQLVADQQVKAEEAGPKVLASMSRFYPDTERVMGWDIGSSGFKIVLSAEVPSMVTRHVGEDVDAFLAAQNLDRKDIGSWVCHTGGPAVLHAFESTLELSPDALALTWRSLKEVGNLSSASVLFVLADTIAQRRPAEGTIGLMLAMGPGFCSELVLLQW